MNMEPTNSCCETVQQEISFALDEQRAISDLALEHARNCPACSAFLSAWTGELEQLLSSPLPPADIALRESVLAMPKHTATSNIIRLKSAISTIAAAALLGFIGYCLVDVRPASTRRQVHQNPAHKELAALKSDLRRGFGTLRAPAGAITQVLNP